MLIPAQIPVAVGKKTPNTVKKLSPDWYDGPALALKLPCPKPVKLFAVCETNGKKETCS